MSTRGVLARFEKALGLPELSQMKGTLNEVNTLLQNLDEKRLSTVRHVGDTLLKLQKEGGVEGLRMFSAVVQVIAQVDNAKLDKIVQITGDVRATADTLHKLAKALPPGMLTELPLKDISDAVKKALAEGK